MTPRPLDVHRVSLDSLRAMAAGDASETDLALLCSAQRSQLLLILRALLDRGDEAARRTRHRGGVPSGRTAWRLLCAAEEQAPEAVEAVLADPTVMAWALRLLRRLNGAVTGAPSAAPLWADLGQFHALAATAALRAGVPCVLRVPAHRGLVWLPGAGMAGPVARRRWSEAEIRVSEEGAVVQGEDGRIVLDRRLPDPAPHWRPLRTVHGLAPGGRPGERPAGPWLDTVSPYRDFTRYPRSPARSGDRRLPAWEARLAGAYALLGRESPADAAALGALVRTLVPGSLRRAEGGMVASASSLDAFGAVMLSLPHDVTQAASVLVHEARHQQLNALLSMVHLVRVPEDGAEGAGEERRYYAPWRSDPRPVKGLLHGVFAFAGVGRFWRTHRSHATGPEAERADFEFAVLREQLAEAVAALLTDDNLTEAGRLFTEEIAAQVSAWQDDEVAAVPAALARHYCALRRAVWRARHLEIPAAEADRLAKAWTAGAAAPALPPSALHARPGLIRPDTFGPLARIRLSAPADFVSRRALADDSGEPPLRAECAAVAGDTEQAAHWFAEWTARDPEDFEAWIGAALAAPAPARERGPGDALLLGRPEAVTGLRRALRAAGGPLPAPADLAAWLAGAGTGD
ncbi:aKG-HExxH-type peptide beta-hydroxylase [Streptomyces sp. LaPpAH-108]|uniref:aKG-HExxH-type peptide beta-hydroxylase n=1 Tax=Streptomyces sp. LaPpAH-108 TaxID=1155714 RepID=UPI0003A96BB7|nr:HEXXH motif-containing putative peptide modification protein [Streptomyces sp. LaPpAH-108]